MRRRRKNTATWLPINPTVYQEGELAVTWYESTLSLPGGAEAGTTSQVAVPLVLDQTVENSAGTQQAGGTLPTLRDFVEGQDYLLQRVVGKVWFGPFADTTELDTVPSESIGCIALAVLPCDEGDQPTIPAEEWNPLWAQNAQQPWIWRRTWRLSNTIVSWPTPRGNLVGYPQQTSGYTGLHEGGHLDAKSRRRITKEHRLFLIAGWGVIEEANAGGGTAFSRFGYDLRVLGSMRRGRNKSSF